MDSVFQILFYLMLAIPFITFLLVLWNFFKGYRGGFWFWFSGILLFLLSLVGMWIGVEIFLFLLQWAEEVASGMFTLLMLSIFSGWTFTIWIWLIVVAIFLIYFVINTILIVIFLSTRKKNIISEVEKS